MLNLDKLSSQFDPNNFDASQITGILLEHQKIVMIVLLVLSLGLAGGMLNGHRLKEQALRARMSQEQGKLGIIKSRDDSIKDLNDFQASLPKATNEFDLITQISNEANSNHVTIASLQPPQSKSMDLYDTMDFSFTAVADDFKDMMLFLRGIEKSNPPLKVNNWSGSEGQDGKISANIQISAVHIHP